VTLLNLLPVTACIPASHPSPARRRRCRLESGVGAVPTLTWVPKSWACSAGGQTWIGRQLSSATWRV